MGRITRGFRLAKASWEVLRSDRSLGAFPIAAAAYSILAFIVIGAPGVVAAAAADKEYVAVPFLLVAGYLTTYFTIYVGVGLAYGVQTVLDGGDATLKAGMAAAKQRRGIIAKWALVQFTIGLILNAISQAGGDSGPGALGAAWGLLTFFVVPILAFEGLGPKQALTRSGGLIKARWGEGVVGAASISFAVFLVMLLPVAAFAAIAIATASSAPAVAVLFAVLAVLVLIIGGVVGSALSQIFRVVLYRYTTSGNIGLGFGQADLDMAFSSKH